MSIATITPVAGAEKVTCQPGQSMECAFTVTSESAGALRIGLQALAEGATKKEWLEVVGERERDLRLAAWRKLLVDGPVLVFDKGRV